MRGVARQVSCAKNEYCLMLKCWTKLCCRFEVVAWPQRNPGIVLLVTRPAEVLAGRTLAGQTFAVEGNPGSAVVVAPKVLFSLKLAWSNAGFNPRQSAPNFRACLPLIQVKTSAIFCPSLPLLAWKGEINKPSVAELRIWIAMLLSL